MSDEAAASQEITAMLRAWGTGDRAVVDQLLPLVYEELGRQAHRYLRRERAKKPNCSHRSYILLPELPKPTFELT